jgi:hypothetical protein
MNLEPLTPENTTVVLIDHAVGFANILRSHDLALHINNVVGLATLATTFGTGLVVTNGQKSKPSGGLYPQLLEVIGDHPVIERGGNFDITSTIGRPPLSHKPGGGAAVLAPSHT